jgi:hypothetical protein
MWQKEPTKNGCCHACEQTLRQYRGPCARSTYRTTFIVHACGDPRIYKTVRDSVVKFSHINKEESTPSAPTQLLQTPLAFFDVLLGKEHIVNAYFESALCFGKSFPTKVSGHPRESQFRRTKLWVDPQKSTCECQMYCQRRF